MITREQIEVKNYTYEKRIVAFADILGWSRATTFIPCLCLGHTLQQIKNYAMMFSENRKKMLQNTQKISEIIIKEYSSIEFSFFSDSFAVSAPIDYGEDVFKILSSANDMLLRRELLVRGGVTIGDLWHNERIIFGPALVEVAKIEEKDALYPRFLCSEKLVKYLDNTDYKYKVILQDFPQSWVVNLACGSSIARDELMAIVQSELDKLNKSDKSERTIRKWRYIQEIMPKMYEAHAMLSNV